MTSTNAMGSQNPRASPKRGTGAPQKQMGDLGLSVSGWWLLTTLAEPIDKGKESTIPDFNFDDFATGISITDSLLKMNAVFFLVAPELEDVLPLKDKFNSFATSARNAGINFICLTQFLSF